MVSIFGVNSFSLLWSKLEYGADGSEVVLCMDVSEEVEDSLSQEMEGHVVDAFAFTGDNKIMMKR